MSKKLTDTTVRNAKPSTKAYKLSDDHSLYLLILPNGAKYWRYDYRFGVKRRTRALGVYPLVSLAEARKRRDEARNLLDAGRDPGAVKKAARQAARLATGNTFRAVALDWLETRRSALTPDYLDQILDRLEADVFPLLGSRPIAEIEAPELLDVLRKVEARGVREVARRLNQTCGQIFRYAIVTGRATRDPSTDLRGALKSPGKTRHHKAMPRDDLPEFLRSLADYQGDPRTRTALQFLTFTFVRTGELIAARWCEFENLDGSEPLWRIPAERMKMKTEHIVPLAPQAVALLRELQSLPGATATPFLFPSPSKHGYMSNNTMLYALYRMGYHGRATVHGFRAVASTLLNEMGFNADWIERQLAHEERNAIRSAYNHATYLPERRRMMEHWANYLDGLRSGSNVVVGLFKKTA